jgi:hypothetical protein
MDRFLARVRSAAVALLAGTFLLGCIGVPVPLPAGYEYGSRENLGDCAPECIISGKTTREEVLLALGQADGVALDESWLSFGCAYGKGGAFFLAYPPVILPGAEAIEYRRLVVYFDEGGVVERVQFDKRICQEVTLATQGGNIKPRPCIDATGQELPLVRQLQRAP